MNDAPSERVIAVLVENHRRFLAFVRSRVGSADAAEEILQAALVRGVEKSGEVRDEETTVAWFYRVLRNGIADHYRAGTSQQRLIERQAQEADPRDDPDLRAGACQCVGELASTLKDEYAFVLRRIDLDEEPIAQVAAEAGITPNNVHVRLHRARAALRKRVRLMCGTCAEHGCLDCSCSPEGAKARTPSL